MNTLFGSRSVRQGGPTAPVRVEGGTSGAETPPAPRRNEERQALRKRVIEKYNQLSVPQASEGDARQILMQTLGGIIDDDGASIRADDKVDLLQEMVAEIQGFGALEPLLSDPSITEIMTVGHRKIFVERNGRMERVPDAEFSDEAALNRIAKKMAERANRNVDAKSPICDAELEDGSRLNIVLPPVAVDGPLLTIRKFRREAVSMDQLLRWNMLTRPAAELLRLYVEAGLNIIMSGAPGTGKTTLVNCLSQYFPRTDRIILCEDTAELQLQHPHVVRMKTRTVGIEGTGAIPMQALVKNTLRMKGTRVIVGEVRDSAALDMVWSFKTGHRGGLATLHADDPNGALENLELFIRHNPSHQAMPSEIIRKQLAEVINVVVQTEQLHDGARVVSHIAEVSRVIEKGSAITTQNVFQYDYKERQLKLGTAKRSLFHERIARFSHESEVRLQALLAGELN